MRPASTSSASCVFSTCLFSGCALHTTSPLPSVGHAARVAAIRALLAREPGLYAIGSAYDGVGIPDTIRLATATGAAIGAQ